MTADYSCAICLDSATDPVVTKCGHLYCWPCLDQWLARQPECPTCKGSINAEKAGDIIPLYGKGKQTADGKTRPQAANSTEQDSTESNSAAAASSAAHAETGAQRHAFDTRHERPRAQRQAPPPNERRGQPRFGRNSWGLCLIGAPTVLSDISYLPVIVLICVAAFYIYKYWKQRATNNNVQGQQGANPNHPPADGMGAQHNAGQNQNAQIVNFVPAMGVLCIAIIYIFLSMIAVDEE